MSTTAPAIDALNLGPVALSAVKSTVPNPDKSTVPVVASATIKVPAETVPATTSLYRFPVVQPPAVSRIDPLSIMAVNVLLSFIVAFAAVHSLVKS